MKIEIAESLIYSYLKHNEGCRFVQTNWMTSGKWVITKYEKERASLLFNKISNSEYFTGIFKNSSFEQLIKQVERIDDIVRYQLSRSVISAGQVLKRKIQVTPEVKKIIEALKKVHAEKALEISSEICSSCFFPGDQGDLMELIGNIADNACKWANSKVVISAVSEKNWLNLSVKDDGPGIPEEKRNLILDRGKRLDQQAEGQGLGLSIVMDIIKNYRGEITIANSELGGSLIIIRIPL